MDADKIAKSCATVAYEYHLLGIFLDALKHITRRDADFIDYEVVRYCETIKVVLKTLSSSGYRIFLSKVVRMQIEDFLKSRDLLDAIKLADFFSQYHYGCNGCKKLEQEIQSVADVSTDCKKFLVCYPSILRLEFRKIRDKLRRFKRMVSVDGYEEADRKVVLYQV